LSLMVETRLFCGLGRKMLTSPGEVQMTTLVSACDRTLESDGRNETFLRSRPEDADISGKGADDYVSLCMLPEP